MYRLAFASLIAAASPAKARAETINLYAAGSLKAAMPRACERRFLRTVLAVLILLLATGAEARSVTDSAGRKVDVPDRIERVFAAGPPASILLYMLAPEKMTGWPDPADPEERPFIAPQYRDLPTRPRAAAAPPTSRWC